MQLLSRPNSFFPRTSAVIAVAVLIMPFARDDPGRYVIAAALFLIPWVIHLLDLRYGVSRHGVGGGDGSGGFFGSGWDCGGGDYGGGGDGG